MNTLPLIFLASGQLGVRATLPITDTEPIGDDELRICVSDESLDRYGEIITASGWQLKNYRRNPVVQNCHQYGDILFTIARALETWVEGGRLCQRWQFASRANPLAKIARDLYAGGFLRAASVGFIPIRWEDATKPDQAHRPGLRRRYLEQELIEVSAVAIPANPNALVAGVQAGAVRAADLDDLLALLKTFRPHPAEPQANARASGLELYEAQWRHLLRQITDVPGAPTQNQPITD